MVSFGIEESLDETDRETPTRVLSARPRRCSQTNWANEIVSEGSAMTVVQPEVRCRHSDGHVPSVCSSPRKVSERAVIVKNLVYELWKRGILSACHGQVGTPPDETHNQLGATERKVIMQYDFHLIRLERYEATVTVDVPDGVPPDSEEAKKLAFAAADEAYGQAFENPQEGKPVADVWEWQWVEDEEVEDYAPSEGQAASGVVG